MSTSLGPLDGNRPVLAALICLWLGLGPVLAAGSLWEAEGECCCGGERVCLLSGCDCGKTGNSRLGECGGLRSADGANDDAVAISFARHLGWVQLDSPVIFLLSTGRAVGTDASQEDLPTRAPDPPPPRSFGVL